MDITSLVTNLGFPVTCVVGLSFFVYKIWFQNEKNSLQREISYQETIKSYNEQLQKNNEALMKISTILDEICDRLDKLEK